MITISYKAHNNNAKNNASKHKGNARKPKSDIDTKRKNAKKLLNYADDSRFDNDILRLQGLTRCDTCYAITPLSDNICCACDLPREN